MCHGMSAMCCCACVSMYFNRQPKGMIDCSRLIGALSSLSLGVMQKYTLFDKGFFDLLDFVTAKIMLPLGGMLVCIFVGWYLKRSVSYAELTNEGTLKAGFFNVYIFILRFIAPIGIALIFINELGLI